MHALPSHGDQKSVIFWFKQRLLKVLSGKRFTETQMVALLALLFWVSTYVLFSVRSVLFPPVAIDVISSKRLLTTLFGAMLFLGAIVGTRRFSKKGRDRHQLLVIFSTIAASTILLLFRVAYNDLAEPYSFGLTDHGRWVLVWGGYFLAGLALLSPERRAAASTTPAKLNSESASETNQAIWVQRNNRSVKVLVSSIEWMEAQGNYVYAHAVEASGLLRSSLSSLEGRLQPHGFIRVHRSALCQKRHVIALKRTSGGALVIILTSGAELSVGRCYASNVTALMSN